MKTRSLIASLFLLTALFSQTSSAGELIFGVKGGVLDIESNLVNADIEKGKNVNLQLGYEFLDLALVDIAVEAEISRSQSDGSINNIDQSFDSKALYASLRTAGPVYLIGRAGIAEVETLDDTLGAQTKSDTGKSLGVGVGFSLGVRFEVEYTTFEVNDTDLKMITFGVAF